MSRKKSRTWEQQMRVDQQNDYDMMHTEQIKLKLNRKTDADILAWLRKKQRWNSGTSMQGEIKRLIRDEIAREATESCRCTPTENEEHTFLNEKYPFCAEQFPVLSRPDVMEYLQHYPDATDKELVDLAEWLEKGYSFTENGYYIADESGDTVDFIQGERLVADMIEAHMADQN